MFLFGQRERREFYSQLADPALNVVFASFLRSLSLSFILLLLFGSGSVRILHIIRLLFFVRVSLEQPLHLLSTTPIHIHHIFFSSSFLLFTRRLSKFSTTPVMAASSSPAVRIAGLKNKAPISKRPYNATSSAKQGFKRGLNRGLKSESKRQSAERLKGYFYSE